MITVIALVLGLTVVALQLSSTQFSPRLLRNFLRDRANKLVLSVFVATFVLFRGRALHGRGVHPASGPRNTTAGRHRRDRAAVREPGDGRAVRRPSGALDQINAVTRAVEKRTLAVVQTRPGRVRGQTPMPPPWAVPVPSSAVRLSAGRVSRSAAPGRRRARGIDPAAVSGREHVVAGTTLGWLWRPSPMIRHRIRSCSTGRSSPAMQDRIRAHVRAGCRVRRSGSWSTWPARRCPGHQRSVLRRCPGDRPPRGDLLLRSLARAVARRRRGRRSRGSGGRDRARQAGLADYLATMCGLIRRAAARSPGP